jgi:hypothetical protein
MAFGPRVSGAHHNAIAQDRREQGLGNELNFLFSLVQACWSNHRVIFLTVSPYKVL